MANVTIVTEAWSKTTPLTPVGTAVDTTSTFLVSPTKGRDLFVLVDNTGTVDASSVTFVKGPTNTDTTAGFNPGVAFQGGLGNWATNVGTTGEHKKWFVIESARFMQNDGTVHMTFAGFSAGKVYVFELPRGA
jgi:hypothetical protein